MKCPEFLTIVGALGLGCLLGFAGARALPSRIWRGSTLEDASGAAAQAEAGLDSSGRLVGANPIEEILAKPRQSRRLVAMNRFCAGLDAAALQRAILEVPDNGDLKNWELRFRLLRRWARLEPAAAAAFALADKNRTARANAFKAVLDVWGRDDPEAASEWVAGIKDEQTLEDTLHEFCINLAQRDFEGTLRFADRLPEEVRDNVVFAAFRAEARENPSGAAARALTMPEGELQGEAMEGTIEEWLRSDAQAAMAWVMQRPESTTALGGKLLDNAVWRWGDLDPEAASRYLQTLPAGRDQDYMLRRLADSWIQQGTRKAFAWAQSLPAGSARTTAMEATMNRWADFDPSSAAAFLRTLPAADQTGKMLEIIGNRWAASDPQGALAWLAAQPKGALAEKLTPQLLGAWAVKDPAGAIAQLATMSEERRVVATKTVAASWAERDAFAAADWMESQPESVVNRATIETVIGTGTSADPARMAQWLENLEGNPRRDLYVAAFAQAAQYYDPTAAADWANTLVDDETRQPLVKKIVRNFANIDSAGARAWIMEQDFDDAERQVLLEQVEQATKRK
jgi:hypothetical protein